MKKIIPQMPLDFPGNPDPNDDPLILFPHAPRTGGHTINTVLIEPYPVFQSVHFEEARNAWQTLRDLGDSELQALRVLRGHGLYYGVHQYISRPCVYMAILRDPVERVISQYSTYRYDPQNGMHDYIVKNNISLEQFQAENPNVQVNYYLGFPHYQRTRPQPADIPKVISTFESSFCYLGITELFDESVFMLKYALGWNHHVFWLHGRKAKKKVPREEISPQMIEQIRNNNIIDYEIYSYAKHKFQTWLDNLSPEIKQELVEYKQGRAVYLEIRKSLPGEFTKNFLVRILQPGISRVAILDSTGQAGEVIQTYISTVNEQGMGRQLEIQNYSAEGEEKLAKVIANDHAGSFLQQCELVVGISHPARDFGISGLLKSNSVSLEKLVFALVPPAI